LKLDIQKCIKKCNAFGKAWPAFISAKEYANYSSSILYTKCSNKRKCDTVWADQGAGVSSLIFILVKKNEEGQKKKN